MRAGAVTRKATLRVAGTVALGAAGHQMLTGAAGVRGAGRSRLAPVSPDLDSELRFYAAWYAVAGALMHRAAADRGVDRSIAPALTGGWAVAAGARLLSMRAVGRPDRLFVALTALELAVAGLLAATRAEDAGGD